MVATKPKVHDFGEQLKVGEDGEGVIFRWFERNGWTVEPTGMDSGQRSGIDAWVSKPNHLRQSVEVKTDLHSFRTGNAFIETVSIVSQSKPGWAYSSKADWVAYYLPQGGYFYFIRMAWLRSQLELWHRAHKEIIVRNKTYKTKGLLVPIVAFEQESLYNGSRTNEEINVVVLNI